MKTVTFGPVEARALEQIERCAQEASAAVLCADHHVGYSQPIGGAIAYPEHVSPSGVGYDIACGNKAVLFGPRPRSVPSIRNLNPDFHIKYVSSGAYLFSKSPKRGEPSSQRKAIEKFGNSCITATKRGFLAFLSCFSSMRCRSSNMRIILWSFNAIASSKGVHFRLLLVFSGDTPASNSTSAASWLCASTATCKGVFPCGSWPMSSSG